MSVQYTSGTTARPKGVVWTHANALWAARVGAGHQDLHPDDCHLAYMPLFHTNSLAMSMLASLWVGARFVLVPKWSTSRFWDVSLQHGCTWLSLMTLSTRAVNGLDVPPRAPVPTLRLGGVRPAVRRAPRGEDHRVVGHDRGRQPADRRRPVPPEPPVVHGAGRRPSTEWPSSATTGAPCVEAEEPGELLVLGTPGLSVFAGLPQPARPHGGRLRRARVVPDR